MTIASLPKSSVDPNLATSRELYMLEKAGNFSTKIQHIKELKELVLYQSDKLNQENCLSMINVLTKEIGKMDASEKLKKHSGNILQILAHSKEEDNQVFTAANLALLKAAKENPHSKFYENLSDALRHARWDDASISNEHWALIASEIFKSLDPKQPNQQGQSDILEQFTLSIHHEDSLAKLPPVFNDVILEKLALYRSVAGEIITKNTSVKEVNRQRNYAQITANLFKFYIPS